MFPVERKIEKVIDVSLYGRIHNAILCVLIFGLIIHFGMPELISYVEMLDSIVPVIDLIPLSFGSIFFFITLLSFLTSVIPMYRSMLIKEIETPNPFISWLR